jgi:hypothetical protein
MQMLTSEILPLQYPVGNLLDTSAAIEICGKGLATFVGLPVSTIHSHSAELCFSFSYIK